MYNKKDDSSRLTIGYNRLHSLLFKKSIRSWSEPGKVSAADKLNKVIGSCIFNVEASCHNAGEQIADYLNGRGVAHISI